LIEDLFKPLSRKETFARGEKLIQPVTANAN